jgi:DNA-binding transcriptional MerR regulator
MSEASAPIRIGEIARRTAVSVRSLRYYEQQGLVTPTRSPSGQRVYRHEDVARVELVRHLLAAGLGTVTIAELLPCIDAPPHERTSFLVARMRAEAARIDTDIARLAEVRRRLQAVIDELADPLTPSTPSTPPTPPTGDAGMGVSPSTPEAPPPSASSA